MPTLRKMFEEGLVGARLNFSHGTHASHTRLVRNIRKASRLAKRNVTILADLQGPKLRLGGLPVSLRVSVGEVVTLPFPFGRMLRGLRRGSRILLRDGDMEAEYLSVSRGTVKLRMRTGGEVESHIGFHIPGKELRGLPALTPKDEEDVAFALSLGVDWVVLSFVTKTTEVRALRRLLARVPSLRRPKIMLKIERAAAVARFPKLLPLADGIMIGRGDLGLDVPPEDVPLIQKRLVATCRRRGVPVVVATHLLESMVERSRPTRAEVSDVANAVIDHVDALLLAGETAKGKYPVEAVAMMTKVIARTEASSYDNVTARLPRRPTKEESLVFSVAELSRAKRIKAIAIPAQHRALVDALDRFRPEAPLFFLSAYDAELRGRLVGWATHPVKVPPTLSLDDPKAIAAFLRKTKGAPRGMPITVFWYRGREPLFTTL